MAVSQITRGVFLVSPDQAKRFEDTLAGQLTTIYTKGRHERWELAKDQAMLEYKVGAERYGEEMKAYRELAKALNDQIKQNSTDIFKAGNDKAKAQDSANKAAGNANVKVGAVVAGMAAKAAEQVNVPQGAESQSSSERESSGTTSSGGGGPVVTAAKQKAQAGIQAAKGERDPLIDPVGLANNVRIRTGVGNIAATDPDTADFTYHSTVEESISAKAGDLMRTGMPGDEARMQAESDVLAALETGKASDFAEGWRRESNKKAAASGVGGGTSRSSGSSQASSVTHAAEQKPKYKDLQAIFPYLSDADKAGILADMAPGDRAELEDALGSRRKELQDQLAALDKPTMSAPDFITRAREVYRGRFGPTTASPGYADRNALEQMGNLTTDQRQELLDAYLSSEKYGPSAPRPAVPTPTPSAPASNQIPLTEADMQGLTDNAPPVIIPEGPYQIPLTEADMQGLTDTAPPVIIPEPPPTEETRTRPSMTEAELAQRRAELETVLGRRAQDRALVDSMLTQGFNTPSVSVPDLRAQGVRPSVPRPVYVPTQTAAPIPSMATRIAGAPPVPPSIGARAEGVLPPPIRPTMDFTEGAPRLPVYGTPESRAMMQKQNETPGMITAGTDLTIGKANAAAVKGSGVRADDSKATASTSYFSDRLNNASALKDQPEKLRRLAATGPGKVAYQLYTANKAKGFAFIPVTYAEIVNTFAGDPDAMKRAHEVAIATAMTAHDNLTPKA